MLSLFVDSCFGAVLPSISPWQVEKRVVLLEQRAAQVKEALLWTCGLRARRCELTVNLMDGRAIDKDGHGILVDYTMGPTGVLLRAFWGP